MATGQNSTSVRKLDVPQANNLALGLKKTAFAHKAASGETGLNLAALVLPSEMPGFVNPTTTEIASANMFVYQKNVTLFSSVRGPLIPKMSYFVTGSTTIQWNGFTSLQDEVFYGFIDPSPRNGLRTVGVQQPPVTGVLSAGTTDFNIGASYPVNQYPAGQMGSGMVFAGTQQMFRNTGNATAAPGADGDYQELNDGSGNFSVIRFNTTKAFNRSIAFVPLYGLVDVPTDSTFQLIASIQGQINNMIPTLAILAGVAQSTFQAAPAYPDLKAFGDRVLHLEQSAIVTTVTTLTQQTFQRVIADSTSGGFTMTLPASPAVGDRVMALDGGGVWGANNVTVAGNGANIQGSSSSFVLDVNNGWAEFEYYNVTRGWIVRIP